MNQMSYSDKVKEWEWLHLCWDIDNALPVLDCFRHDLGLPETPGSWARRAVWGGKYVAWMRSHPYPIPTLDDYYSGIIRALLGDV